MNHSPKLIARTKKVLEENNLCDHGPGNGILDMIPKAHVTKEKRIKYNSSKIKTFVFQRIPLRK